MKKEIYDALIKKHQEQKALFAKAPKFNAQPITLGTFSLSVKTETQAAIALSKVLGDDITPSQIIWGVPISKQGNILPLGSGYLYKLSGLGWLLIWHNDAKILFLDKTWFEVEEIFSFTPRQVAVTSLTNGLKKKIIAVVTIAILLILALIFN